MACKVPAQQRADSLVGAAPHARVDGDAICASATRAPSPMPPQISSSTPACPELTGQRAVARAVPLEDAFGPDRAVLHLVELELTGMAKVLKDVSHFHR